MSRPEERYAQFVAELPKGSEWAWVTRSLLLIAPFNENPYILDLRRDPPSRLNLDPSPAPVEDRQTGNGETPER